MWNWHLIRSTMDFMAETSREVWHRSRKQSNFRAATWWLIKQDARFTIGVSSIGRNKRSIQRKCSNTKTELNWTKSYRRAGKHVEVVTDATETFFGLSSLDLFLDCILCSHQILWQRITDYRYRTDFQSLTIIMIIDFVVVFFLPLIIIIFIIKWKDKWENMMMNFENYCREKQE